MGPEVWRSGRRPAEALFDGASRNHAAHQVQAKGIAGAAEIDIKGDSGLRQLQPVLHDDGRGRDGVIG